MGQDEREGIPPADALRRQAGRAVGYLARPRSYAGLAREAALTSVHLSAYPLGLLPGGRVWQQANRKDAAAAGSDLPADSTSAAMPVVLVHGYVHNRSAFLVMAQALKRAGFAHVHGFNYNPLLADLHQIAAHLGAEVERITRTTGASKVALVGHSMGGMVARHFVQLLDGHDAVHTVITIGAPHRGSYTAYLGFGPAAAQLRPGSTYLHRLEASARPNAVRWISYYSDLDFLVVPAVHGKLVHPALAATNIRVNDTGHLSMLLSRKVLRGITEHLASSSAGPGASSAATALPSTEANAIPRGAT